MGYNQVVQLSFWNHNYRLQFHHFCLLVSVDMGVFLADANALSVPLLSSSDGLARQMASDIPEWTF